MPGSNAEFGMVTTPRFRYDLEPEARRVSERLSIPFIKRSDTPFEALFAAHGVPAFYVVTDRGPHIMTPEGKLMFHEGTATVRTNDAKQPSALVRAMDLRPGDRVLDATLGFAGDALVVAEALEDVHVLGLEFNPLVEDIVRLGLLNGPFSRERLRLAATRIRTQRADHAEFLRDAPDGSFDAVYFDTMFSVAVSKSSAMQRLRSIAEKRPLSDETVEHARRVARRCVILKRRRGVFDHVPFDRWIPSGKNLIYGVLDARR